MDRSRREFLAMSAAAGTAWTLGGRAAMAEGDAADVILFGGRFATMNSSRPFAEAVSIRAGRFSSVGAASQVMREKGPATRVIDVKGRTVIPGLIDSHTHPIRGGLNYNLELRWDGVPSLFDALGLLREQARRTPPPHWVRVVGGWTEFQFKERRMPTLDEINAAAPDTPVFVLHLYDRAWLNGAALRAVGYTRETPEPPGAHIERDKSGNPTGLLIARPNARVLYATLAKGPKLGIEDQVNSTRRFMRELNRLGITSVVDAGGGFQNYPEDYKVIDDLARQGQLTTRIAYNLFTQRPTEELADFSRWTAMAKPRQQDDFYRLNGAGEMLVYSAADFEDFREPRPDMPTGMEPDLTAIVTHLARNRWPFRMHATYDETIGRALDVFERVDRDVPLASLGWFFDHAETISPRNIDRVKALGGGIAIQDRMAFQGEYFVDRYGAKAAQSTPPIVRMLEAGVPVGAGTDATRVSSYNPFYSLYWLVTGKTLGGLALYPRAEPAREDGGLATLDGRQCLVLGRGRQEGHARAGATGGSRRPHGRLLLGARGADQGPRIRSHHRRRQGRPCGEGVRLARARASASEPELGARPPRPCRDRTSQHCASDGADDRRRPGQRSLHVRLLRILRKDVGRTGR